MLDGLLWLILGAAAGAAGVVWWNRPAWEAVRSLLRVADAHARGDWKQRVTLDGRRRVGADVRHLADTTNATAERTLRQVKDLARRQSDLRALVDALPDPILLADTRRKVILINAPAAELLGVTKEQALGQSLEAAVSEPAVLGLFDRVREIDLHDTDHLGVPRLPMRREVRLSRDGKPLAFQAVATRSGAGGVLVVLRDISTLDQALRMKADFVANAGHELRTPVSAIKAAFETLVDIHDEGPDAMAQDAEAVARCLNILGGHLLRLEEMLRDLLDLSRVESGGHKPVWEPTTAADLSRDLRQTLGGMAAEKGVKLALPVGGRAEAVRFVTDYRLLMLALKNLVENGVKYTPRGGTVTVTAEVAGLVGDAADMHRRLTGRPYSEVVLRVQDTGVGIAAENLDRVFERFYQVDAARTGTNPRTSGRGTGLGLSIVKHAVGALGGTVRVESVAGEGSTFTVILPQARDAAPAEDLAELA